MDGDDVVGRLHFHIFFGVEHLENPLGELIETTKITELSCMDVT